MFCVQDALDPAYRQLNRDRSAKAAAKTRTMQVLANAPSSQMRPAGLQRVSFGNKASADGPVGIGPLSFLLLYTPRSASWLREAKVLQRSHGNGVAYSRSRRGRNSRRDSSRGVPAWRRTTWRIFSSGSLRDRWGPALCLESLFNFFGFD